jgi:elongation factor Ts
VAEITAQAVKELRDRTGAGMMECKKALADASGDGTRAAELLRERGLAKAVKRSGRATSEGAIGISLDGARGALVELACETDFVAKTPDFQKLAVELAAAAAADPKIDSPEALLASEVEGQKGEERLQQAIARLGENMLLRRVARVQAPAGGRVGGYVHLGGKLGALVALDTRATGPAVETLAKDLAMHVTAADPSPVAVDKSGVPAAFLEQERALFRRQAEQEGKPAKVIDKIVEGRVAKLYKEVCLVEQPFVKDPDRTVAVLLQDVGRHAGSEIRVTGFARFKLGESEKP